ncbi:hypothetical protein QYE76_066280 [Lolium multiflorum]|uniref:RNase H type-1 domain-containing protein n=1 Tax=Lolium multiflorum TaxID=4521 RepID=A0AAD8SAQ5_LOLMU|nr:hypothetical protein QYE76_066280 [Lolium multiflorum]
MYLEEPMDMAFGRFHFRVGKEGSHRLARSDSARSVAAGSDSSGSVSSFESGDEEISSTVSTKLASSGELIKIFSNISVGSSADSSISSDSDSVDTFDFIDQSASVREVFADLHEGVTNIDDNQVSTHHQVYVIGEASRAEPETSEAFDDLGNPYVDPADLMRDSAKEEDEVKTAFITPYGVFCYRTMPFGLKNAGATYQRMMQKCLATQIGKNVQVYIDDVVITTKEGSTLIDDLRETFDNLDKFCLKLNPTKCSSASSQRTSRVPCVTIGIEANQKIQAIVTMRKPTKLKEIQQLTGRVAALSRFVARLGERALPFYALIKQGEKFEWNEEADRAFEDLKRTISTPPILVAPKKKEPLLLYIAATPQILPDFVAEWMELQNTGPPDLSRTWTMNFDGSKRLEGAGAGVILVSPQGDKLKYVLRMTFPNASNDEAEYEARIHGMKMAKACGATRLKIYGDSQLVAQQVMNQCDAVNDSMIAYKELYNELEKLFDGCEVNHVSRLSNDEADVLANIGSQCLAIPPGVFWEEISERSTKARKQPKKKEKVEKGSGASAALEAGASGDEEESHEVMVVQVPWMQAYIAYISRQQIPEDPVEARRIIRRSKAFTVVKGELYKKSISGVLQRCVTAEEGRVLSKDVHEGRKPRYEKVPAAAAIEAKISGTESLFRTPPGRGSAPEGFSIDTAAISTAIFITAAAPMKRE